MEFLLVWLVCSVIIGVIASSRGRSGVGWFLIAALLSPLIGLILVLVFQKKGEAAAAVDEAGQKITADSHVRCPDCRELVRKDAKKCKHCGTALIPQ